MKTRHAFTSRTRFLSIILTLVVLGLVVLGLVFMSIANSYPYIPGGPITPEADFFWTGGMVLVGAGMLAGIGAVVMAIVIAVRTARANANLRRLREQLISAREEERRRLRRDLHDGIGPQLASQVLTVVRPSSVQPLPNGSCSTSGARD